MDGGAGDTSDLDRHIEQPRHCETITESEVRQLCFKATEILLERGDEQRVDDWPVSACGDMRGQFHDLKELFAVDEDAPIAFVGDFVDRGFYSVETFLLLPALKVWYPDQLTLIWGNHERRRVAQVRAFYDENVRKYVSANVWRYCTDVFAYLSLSTLVDGKVSVSMVFCRRQPIPSTKSGSPTRCCHTTGLCATRCGRTRKITWTGSSDFVPCSTLPVTSS